MVQAEHHRVGREHLEPRLFVRRQRLHAAQFRAVLVERFEVVVGGVEPVVREVEQGIDELAHPGRIAPLRAELLRLVVARDRRPEHDPLAVHFVVAVVVLELVTQVVDPFADRLGQRIDSHGRRTRGGCDRRRLAERDDRQRDAQDCDEQAKGARGHQRAIFAIRS